MPISADCPQCGKTYRVKEEFAGKKFRCKACQGVVSVPEAKAPSGDPWDDLDLDSFQDPPEPEEDEFEAPPVPRRPKSRKKKAKLRRSSGSSGGGTPVGVMIAIATNCVLIVLNLVGIVGNIMSENPGGACGSVFRILIEGAIILGLLEANSVARWASIALSILGMLACLTCCAVLLLGDLPGELQQQFPVAILIAVLGVQIVIWGVNIVALLLPSSSEFFN